MKKWMFVFCTFSCMYVHSQQYVHQVYVLNEGYFDYQTNQQSEPVTLGTYNPTSQQYQVVDTIENMRFGSDLLVTEFALFVAADQQILKYDKFTNQLVGSINCPGVRNLAVFENKLLATRGEYLTTFDSYLHVYDANNLQLIQAYDTISGPKWATQNLVVDGSTVFVAVNNAYEWGNEKGLIGKLDMTTMTYGNEIDLGPDGKNPDNLVLQNGNLLTVNNKDWSGASVSKVAIGTNVVTTSVISSAVTGCGTSCLRDDKLVYQISGESVLNEWDVNLMQQIGPVSGINTSFYELAQHPISGEFYATETDYFSFGKVHIYASSNQELSVFNVGVSPGTVAFDVRSSVGQAEMNEISCTVYPNPTTENLFVKGIAEGSYRLVDFTGKVLIHGQFAEDERIDVSDLRSGIYRIICHGQNGFVTSTFLKL